MLGFGVNMFGGSKPDNTIVVNGEEIPSTQFARTRNMEEQRLRSMLGPQYASLAGTFLKNLDSRVADNLIQGKLFEQFAKKIGLSGPGDEVVKKKIKESFTQGWSIDAYTRLLASLGVTALKFQEDFRDELRKDQLRQIIVDSSFPTIREIDRSIITDHSTYQLNVISADTEHFTKNEFRNVSDDILRAYYQGKERDFQVKPAVQYSFVALTKNNFPNLVEIHPEDVEQFYKQNIDEFKTQQSIRFRHIQLTTPAGLSESEKKAYESEVTSLFSKIRDGGLSFSRGVTLFSDDYATRWNEGKTELIHPGQLVSALESTIWKHVSDQDPFIVTTDYGYHIVEVLDYKPSTPKPFSKVKNQIEKILYNEAAGSFLNEKGQQLYDEWVNSNKSLMDFAASKSLKAFKTREKLSPDRDPTETGGTPISQDLSPKDLIMNGLTSSVIKFHEQTKQKIKLDDRYVLVEVNDYQAESLNPFENVRQQVLEHYVNDNASTLAKAELEKLISDIKAGTIKNLQDVGLSGGLSFQESITINLSKEDSLGEFNFPGFLDEIRSLKGATGIAHKVVTSSNGKFYIFEVVQATPPNDKIIQEKREEYRNRATDLQSEVILRTILNYQKAHSEIKLPKNLSTIS